MKLLLSILVLTLAGSQGIKETTRTNLTAQERLQVVARARELVKESGLLSEAEKGVVAASDPKVAYYRLAGRFAQYTITWSFSDGSAIVIYGEGNLPELTGAKVMRKPKAVSVDAQIAPQLLVEHHCPVLPEPGRWAFSFKLAP